VAEEAVDEEWWAVVGVRT